ncbi:MAG: glycosyltransferase family 4 protein [Pseudomonadota bacterium]
MRVNPLNLYDEEVNESRPITIMIHDLNPWGGQDRSMLEIAWQLNKKFPLEIHSYSIQGYEQWPDMRHVRYESLIKKPILMKYLSYHFQSWQNLTSGRNQLIQSTGTASLKSHVVQVQFIHHQWQKISKRLPPDKNQSPSVLHSLYHRLLNSYKKFLEKKVYTPDKHYIAISHSIKKELMENFDIPAEHIKIIYHGVDTDYFQPLDESPENSKIRKEVRDSLGIQDDEKVLLHVGALNARKGIFQTLKTLSYLKKQGFPKIRFLAVGQGDQTHLKAAIKNLDLEDEVIFAPHSKDIRRYYWASDVFFFPSLYEPFGLVILEAMACGLPSVVSKDAGGAELIEHLKNGVLINPQDTPHNVANELLPLLRDPDVCHRLGSAGRQTALKRSWLKVGEEYRQFYQNPPWTPSESH